MSQGSSWHYGTAADLGRSLSDRFRDFPRQPDALIGGVRLVAALALRGWLKVYHHFTITGRENLPGDGSFVMVANHTSHLDGLCMLSALPLRRLNRAYPAAAEDYFFVSLPRVAAAAIFVNAMPFCRQNHMRQSMDLCRRLLRDRGNILILFPEGTRSPNGELREFRPGVGSLLAGLTVPVVPCAIRGAYRALPKGSILPRPRPLRLHIGEPRNYGELEAGKDSARHITRELHDAVKELLCDCAS
jgi:1-acyl-sn-glycerol-3-phosphate acyltransferase